MATKEGETSVLWDMNSCPVWSIFDAGRVGPCIKRAMKNLGYSGHVTITAVGILKRFPADILRAVYSSGVSLTHVNNECLGIDLQIYNWVDGHRPPSNFMLISCERSFLIALREVETSGHNVIRQFPFVQQVVASTPIPFPVWESFLASLPADAIDSGVLDKNPGWRCELCFCTSNQDFESFTSHLCDNHSIHLKKRKQPEGVGHKHEKVLVLAATNTPYALDQAIRRCFDKRIYIPLPEAKARQHMFKVLKMSTWDLGDTPHNLTEPDLENLGLRTQGFSGSDVSVCVKDVLFEPVRETQDAMFFFKSPEDTWMPCGPKHPGAIQTTMQDLAVKGLCEKGLRKNF